MRKTMICTVCPNGCEITAEYTSVDNIEVSGCLCNRGITYAKNECFDPRRVFTSSVFIENGYRRLLPVRTTTAIKANLLMKGAAKSRTIKVKAPICCGEVIVKNFLGTEADLIASMSIEEVR